MSGINRRTLLTGSGAALGAVALGATPAGPSAEAAAPNRHTAAPAAGDTVGPDDPRYAMLTTGNNKRFTAAPEYIRMIRSAADAEQALADAVRAGKRISVRSGGHCFADLVCNPDVEVLLDFSELNGVSYDPGRGAFAVEPGARLLNVYEALYKGWGVTIPGGMCYSVGAGGHIAGGGYGLLSRTHGLVADHLYAVEVVVVDADRRVRTVVATREEGDPNRELWWAHTGGGGGNFGLVTRYWFRSPGATGGEPSRRLVNPPSEVLVSAPNFPWDGLGEVQFARLMRNFGAWHESNSAPGARTSALGTVFNVCHQAHGSLDMFTQIDALVPGAERILEDYLSALTAGTGLEATPTLRPRRMTWLDATRLIGTNDPTITNPGLRGAHKSAYLRKGFTEGQIATMYRRLTDGQYWNADTMIVLFGFGGQVNAVAPDATATSQRSSAFKMLFQTFWSDPSDDDAGLGWARAVYEDFFADTGGVPAPGERYQGCYINYPDTDLKDPARNRSGIPWPTLYYRDNYQRLQGIKHRWDPTGFFRHSLAVS